MKTYVQTTLQASKAAAAHTLKAALQKETACARNFSKQRKMF